MQTARALPHSDDIDLAALGRSIWRAKGWILVLAIGLGVLTYAGLSTVRPLYSSEARILISNDETVFTRPAAESVRERAALDQQAIESQVQVLNSRDLALEVIKELDLTQNAEFMRDGGVGSVRRLLNSLGLGVLSPRSELERAADTFADHLSVYQLAKSSVVAVQYTSGDPELAAEVANKLAEAYLSWQRQARLDETRNATLWLSQQIEELRKRVADSEAEVEQFRSKTGIYAGSNDVTLNAQQLSELNSQLIQSNAQKSEAEARARLIKKMLDENGEIEAMPDVVKSDLVSRLIEQRVQVQRQLAELSATLLPSHPRMQQLNAELRDIQQQIRDEASKIVKALESEAEVASAREASLRNSLNEAKSEASVQSDDEIKLRALEREAKANRDLLESYLARYQDASARDLGSVPANATIVSRAHASSTPSFPKKGPIALLVVAATILLSVALIIARELLAAAPMAPTVRAGAGAAGPERATDPDRYTTPYGMQETRQDTPPASSLDRLVKDSKQASAPEESPQARDRLASILAARSQRRVPTEPIAVPPLASSLDELMEEVLAASRGTAPAALLVTSGDADGDAGGAAIQIARVLADTGRVVLLDISRGGSSAAKLLRLPRAPGFYELLGERVGFEEVIQLDRESALQVIPAGHPIAVAGANAKLRFEDILRALTETYESVIIQADHRAAERFAPLLTTHLSVAVVAFGPSERSPRFDLSTVEELGCPVIAFEPTEEAGLRGKVSGLFNRVAAI